MAGTAAEHEAETSVAKEDLTRAALAGTRVDLSPVADRVIQLQRAAGNRAVNRLLGKARRTLARDGDPYDRGVTRWATLDAPSVAFNADNVAPMALTQSPVIKEGQDLYSAIGQYVKHGTKHLVINCHGFVSRPNFGAPHLAIGNVLHAGNVQWFDQVAGNVGVIWVSACNILSATDGEEFCKQLASIPVHTLSLPPWPSPSGPRRVVSRIRRVPCGSTSPRRVNTWRATPSSL